MNLTDPQKADLMSVKSMGIGDGWRVYDCLCRAGPHDRPFAEQHPYVSVAMVAAGSFTYRSTHGTALLTPGSLLSSNAYAEFECRHEHASGDRCIAFHFTPSFFNSVAAALPVSRIDFRCYRVPLLPELVPLFAEVTVGAARPHPLRLEELALELAAISLRRNADGSRCLCTVWRRIADSAAIISSASSVERSA
jgi:AraC family transcriptional regulator